MTYMRNFHYVIHLVIQSGNIPHHVIDAGVCKSLYLEFWRGAFDRITGFEPSPKQYEEIHKNFIQHLTVPERENMTLHKLGLSDYDGISKFYFCKKDPAYSVDNWDRITRLVEDKGLFDYDDWEPITIEMVKLDTFFENDTRIVNVLKVDTENDDLLVIDGGKKLIERTRPAIQLEHVMYTPHQIDRCMSMMNDLHYQKVTPPFESDNHYFVPCEWKL